MANEMQTTLSVEGQANICYFDFKTTQNIWITENFLNPSVVITNTRMLGPCGCTIHQS